MASIEERLNRIEAELARISPPSPEWVRDTLGPLPPGMLERIAAPGTEILNRGGKRWRPLLMLLCCEACGGGDRVLPLTPLVELPHNGSLIVDDIEDNSAERRGGPAVHLQYGLDLAINAGNLFYFLPFQLLDRHLPDEAERGRVYRIALEDLLRLHVGQGLDILWHRDPRALPSVAEYLQMCRLKTGSLARLAARVGTVVGGGGDRQAATAGVAAENFGVAFQIIDDVANLAGGVPGKRRGDDIVEGKKSLPVILFLARRPEQAARLRALFARASGAGGTAAAAVEEACTLIAASGSLAEAGRVAAGLLEEARSGITAAFPAGEARALLLGLAESLVPARAGGDIKVDSDPASS